MYLKLKYLVTNIEVCSECSEHSLSDLEIVIYF